MLRLFSLILAQIFLLETGLYAPDGRLFCFSGYEAAPQFQSTAAVQPPRAERKHLNLTSYLAAEEWREYKARERFEAEILLAQGIIAYSSGAILPSRSGNLIKNLQADSQSLRFETAGGMREIVVTPAAELKRMPPELYQTAIPFQGDTMLVVREVESVSFGWRLVHNAGMMRDYVATVNPIVLVVSGAAVVVTIGAVVILAPLEAALALIILPPLALLVSGTLVSYAMRRIELQYFAPLAYLAWRRGLSTSQVQSLQRAFWFSYRHLPPETRLLPEHLHPSMIAWILLDCGETDIDTLCAGMLYGVKALSAVEAPEAVRGVRRGVLRMFGEDIARLVMQTTRLEGEGLGYLNKVEVSESLVGIETAARIQTLGSLEALEPEQRQTVLNEIENHTLPLLAALRLAELPERKVKVLDDLHERLHIALEKIDVDSGEVRIALADMRTYCKYLDAFIDICRQTADHPVFESRETLHIGAEVLMALNGLRGRVPGTVMVIEEQPFIAQVAQFLAGLEPAEAKRRLERFRYTETLMMKHRNVISVHWRIVGREEDPVQRRNIIGLIILFDGDVNAIREMFGDGDSAILEEIEKLEAKYQEEFVRLAPRQRRRRHPIMRSKNPQLAAYGHRFIGEGINPWEMAVLAGARTDDEKARRSLEINLGKAVTITGRTRYKKDTAIIVRERRYRGELQACAAVLGQEVSPEAELPDEKAVQESLTRIASLERALEAGRHDLSPHDSALIRLCVLCPDTILIERLLGTVPLPVIVRQMIDFYRRSPSEDEMVAAWITVGKLMEEFRASASLLDIEPDRIQSDALLQTMAGFGDIRSRWDRLQKVRAFLGDAPFTDEELQQFNTAVEEALAAQDLGQMEAVVREEAHMANMSGEFESAMKDEEAGQRRWSKLIQFAAFLREGVLTEDDVPLLEIAVICEHYWVGAMVFRGVPTGPGKKLQPICDATERPELLAVPGAEARSMVIYLESQLREYGLPVSLTKGSMKRYRNIRNALYGASAQAQEAAARARAARASLETDKAAKAAEAREAAETRAARLAKASVEAQARADETAERSATVTEALEAAHKALEEALARVPAIDADIIPVLREAAVAGEAAEKAAAVVYEVESEVSIASMEYAAAMDTPREERAAAALEAVLGKLERAQQEWQDVTAKAQPKEAAAAAAREKEKTKAAAVLTAAALAVKEAADTPGAAAAQRTLETALAEAAVTAPTLRIETVALLGEAAAAGKMERKAVQAYNAADAQAQADAEGAWLAAAEILEEKERAASDALEEDVEEALRAVEQAVSRLTELAVAVKNVQEEAATAINTASEAKQAAQAAEEMARAAAEEIETLVAAAMANVELAAEDKARRAAAAHDAMERTAEERARLVVAGNQFELLLLLAVDPDLNIRALWRDGIGDHNYRATRVYQKRNAERDLRKARIAAGERQILSLQRNIRKYEKQRGAEPGTPRQRQRWLSSKVYQRWSPKITAAKHELAQAEAALKADRAHLRSLETDLAKQRRKHRGRSASWYRGSPWDTFFSRFDEQVPGAGRFVQQFLFYRNAATEELIVAEDLEMAL